MRKQRAWRTMTTTNSGYFIWEVLECIGEPEHFADTKTFIQCRDNSYVMAWCTHTFNEKTAISFLGENGYDQQIIIIPTKES